jgi:hypothetical protein
VRVLRNGSAAISLLVSPPVTNPAMCNSCCVSSSTAETSRLRTVSPVARSSASARSAHGTAPSARNIPCGTQVTAGEFVGFLAAGRALEDCFATELTATETRQLGQILETLIHARWLASAQPGNGTGTATIKTMNMPIYAASAVM